jgi:outer membrane protein TolC
MRKICRSALGLLLLLSGCKATQSAKAPFAERTLRTEDSLAAGHAVDVESSGSGSSPANASPVIAEVAPGDRTERRDESGTTLIEAVSYSDETTAGEVQSSQPPATVDSGTELREPVDAASNVDNSPAPSLQLEQVIGSVYDSYPLMQAALFNRNVALGQQLAAQGEFDTKVKGGTENNALGFYETYRHHLGFVQPTYWGGQYFAGYRIGRGNFEPWYLERNTNDGGEFKSGVQIPLARNRDIDTRRAELWKAGFERQLAEPDIQAQLIGFVQESSYAYWRWVAAGETHRIAQRILFLADSRTDRIEAQVKAGFIDPPELTDNLRLVAIREAKVADTRRKLEQTAARLSAYWRDSAGNPIVPDESQLPGFPEPEPIQDLQLEADVVLALSNRPELRMLDLYRRQLDIDYTEATNQLQPELDAVVWAAQDVGAPTSSKRDKSPLDAEASIFLDVPLQRRKARGKLTAVQGKVAQVNAKRKLVADKISIDVQTAHAGLISAFEQVALTRRAIEQAEDLAERERESQEAGRSDMLKVTLREEYAVESAEKNVEALLLYFEAQADYRAALGLDRINR